MIYGFQAVGILRNQKHACFGYTIYQQTCLILNSLNLLLSDIIAPALAQVDGLAIWPAREKARVLDVMCPFRAILLTSGGLAWGAC